MPGWWKLPSQYMASFQNLSRLGNSNMSRAVYLLAKFIGGAAGRGPSAPAGRIRDSGEAWGRNVMAVAMEVWRWFGRAASVGRMIAAAGAAGVVFECVLEALVASRRGVRGLLYLVMGAVLR